MCILAVICEHLPRMRKDMAGPDRTSLMQPGLAEHWELGSRVPFDVEMLMSCLLLLAWKDFQSIYVPAARSPPSCQEQALGACTPTGLTRLFSFHV